MSYLIDINEDLSDELRAQMRKFRSKSALSGIGLWYRINVAVAKARELRVYHDKIENFTMPNLYDGRGDAIDWYHWRDPQESQVNMVKENLKVTSLAKRKRGRVTPRRLRFIMLEILNNRIDRYLNPEEYMGKQKLMCIVGDSGCGKTLASLHLKYKIGANVICSFTTRPPRPTEMEGRDHHFVDIVPDPTEILAYTHFGSYYYYALKTQVYGPCTVYVIDEKGLQNLKSDCGDEYDITSVYLKRNKDKRKRCGVSDSRLHRDENRKRLPESDYDFVIENNSTKKNLFTQIEEIYEYVKNKEV